MKLVSLAALAAAMVLPVAAQAATPRVDQREADQQARIQQGVQSGQLTSREATHLEKGQAHVQTMEDQAKADGKVTPKERARLTRAQDKQSRKIYHRKHNARTTRPAG